MNTVQMTLDEALVRRVDRIRKQLRQSRSAFTRKSVLGYLGEVTIAPITSTVRGIPSEVELSPADGMRQVCAINCDDLQTVANGRIGALITTLGRW